MIETNAMTGHPGFGHQAVDCSVAVNQEVGRDVDLAGGGKLFTCNLGTDQVEVIPGRGKRRYGGPMQYDHLRADDYIRGFRVLMRPPIRNGQVDALLVEIDGFLFDAKT